MNESETGDVTVLLIDDDPDHLEMLELMLRRRQKSRNAQRTLNIETFTDPAEALAHLSLIDSAVIVCDFEFPDGTGLDWMPHLLKSDAGPVIFLTAHADAEMASRAFKNGASDFLLKDSVAENPELLEHAISGALRRSRLESRNNELQRELMIANSELEQKNEKLRELMDTAHRFVDDVAHEFRTPLTVIKEFASILDDGMAGEVNTKQHEYLGFIEHATRELAQLVDDFLDCSKLRAGKLRVDRRPFEVADLLASVRPMLQCRAASKNITITENIEPNLARVFADEHMASRVIVNLTVNAIKFSPPNSEIVVYARTGSVGDVEIGTTDAGPGLSTDEQKFLFERFNQVGRLRRTSEKGFGLGLTIAKELVWLNLGSMDIRSTPGEGSTFSFTLPPNDPEIVISRYLEHVGRLENAPSTPFSLLHAAPTNGCPTAEQIRHRLAGQCRSLDLVVPAVDGRSVLLIGPSEQPDDWIARLGEELEAMRSESDDEHFQPVDLSWVGTWSFPQQREKIIAAAINRTLGVTAGV